MTSTLAPPALRWDGTRLHVLDQTLLPAREQVLVLGARRTPRRRSSGCRSAGRR